MTHLKAYETRTTRIQDVPLEDIRHGKYLLSGKALALMNIDEKGEIKLIWIATAFEILQVRINQDTKEFQYQLRIRSSIDDVICTVSKSAFTKRGLDELTRYGLSYNASLSDAILEYAVLEEAEAEKTEEYTRLGWLNGCFKGYPMEGQHISGMSS